MKKMLIIRPDYDIGTNYLFLWSEEVIDFATQKNWHVEKSDGEKATKQDFESRINNKPNFIFINGHGAKDVVVGHAHIPLVNLSNCSLLKNTITFTRACNCIQELGKKSVEEGCTAFIGYSKEFWVPRLHSYESTPLKDPLAKPVIEVSNSIPISIIKGHSVEESINNSKSLAEKHLLKLILSKEPNDRAVLRAMLNNISALDYEGKKDARIE